MNNRTINISDFDYELPEERIAKFPTARRDESRLLIYRGGKIAERRFVDLPDALPAGATLVFNNTRVVRARIVMHKPSGARVEVFCLEPHSPADHERAFAARGTCEWLCIVGNLKKWKEGPLEISFSLDGAVCSLRAWREDKRSDGKQTSGAGTSAQAGGSDTGTGGHVVRFEWDADLTFGQLLERLGRIPIPPYLGREGEDIDNTRYQTVYSLCEGSVAAPTAGLHFTPELIDGMRARGFRTEQVTLHVGAGTFLPVKEENAALHAMHTEHFEVSLTTLRALATATSGLFPVGTTSVRTLESLAALGYRTILHGDPDASRTVGQWEAYDIPEDISGAELLAALVEYMEARGEKSLKASTRIMITPGYRFRLVDGVVTNFHQPRSTLLLLVSALIGDDWRKVYDHALAKGFRFLSYGDSSLLFGRRWTAEE